ncbi:hypothetical protein N665_0218s0048 [Sinapis alba]|nr:hypothetical protein N665_0218s0048 [Sinapis alba]
MYSPIRRCSLIGKAIATAFNSDNSSSPRLRGPRTITLGGMIPRPTSEDLAELNDNKHSVVQFNLELEEREATVQVPVDDVVQETEPISSPIVNPGADTGSVDKDKASAEKEISLALDDLLPMRWTGNDFEFDEEIDPEQERRLSAKKNQNWENHFPTRSTFKSVRRLTLQTSPPAGFSFLIPADHQRPWNPPVGYACVYKSLFNNCSLWWPLPEFLTTYCSRRKIALGQYTANGIRILVMLTFLAAEFGIKMSVRLFEKLTTPSITAKMMFFYGKMVPKYNVITRKPSKMNFWNRAYFYIKINEASFEDPSVILNGYFNANIDRLSKWSQGGSRSFLEEVEAIRTLSHQHWPDISEAHEGALLASPNRSPPSERPEEHLGDDDQEPQVQENPSLEPSVEAEVVITDEVPTEEHPVDLSTGEKPQGDQFQEPDQAAHGDEIKLKKKGMPELEQLWQNSRYREMTRAGAIFFGNVNLMVRDNEAKLRTQDEKLALKTVSLKRKIKEIAELASKSRNELLSKELEELKAQNEGLDTRCRNLEQEKTEVELRFETTTRRLRESREHEVRKERLWVDSALRQQVAPVYEKVCQFIEEQPSIQFKLDLYSQAKRTREGLEKIQTQGLSMDEVLQQARDDEVKYQEELQGMEVVGASEIDLVPIGLDKHDSNMMAFSPQDIEDLRV